MEYLEVALMYLGVFSAGGLSTFLLISWIVSSSKRDSNRYDS